MWNLGLPAKKCGSDVCHILSPLWRCEDLSEMLDEAVTPLRSALLWFPCHMLHFPFTRAAPGDGQTAIVLGIAPSLRSGILRTFLLWILRWSLGWIPCNSARSMTTQVFLRSTLLNSAFLESFSNGDLP